MASIVTTPYEFGPGGHTVKGPLKSYDDDVFVNKHMASLRWVIEECQGTVLYVLGEDWFALTFQDPNEAFEYKIRWI